MTTLQHYLRPLLVPASIAFVGATSRAGSLGRIVIENLLEGDFKGEIHFVNPHHRRVFGRRCHTTLRAIGKPVELALIAVPCAAVPSVLDDGARAGVKAAVLLSAPPGDEGDARRWEREVMATARKRRIRLLGPHAFGVIRTDVGARLELAAGLRESASTGRVFQINLLQHAPGFKRSHTQPRNSATTSRQVTNWLRCLRGGKPRNALDAARVNAMQAASRNESARRSRARAHRSRSA